MFVGLFKTHTCKILGHLEPGMSVIKLNDIHNNYHRRHDYANDF